MKAHSIAYAITNSSSETYHFPRYQYMEDLFSEMLQGLWLDWVETHPDEFRDWAWCEARSRCHGRTEEDVAKQVESFVGYCPLRGWTDEAGVPQIDVQMTGSDSPCEFDEYLLRMMGGRREC